jgi:hypothetical protein
MTEYHNPALKVRIVGGSTYICERNGNSIVYRPNQAQIANVVLDNSDNSLDTVFNSTEQRVDVLIENDLMMTGYVVRAAPNFKNFKKVIQLQIADWGGYLASKLPFEKNYDALTGVPSVFLDSANSVRDNTDSLGYNVIDYSIDTKVLKEYLGTYVKDVWQDAAKSANVVWFCDENKKLNFFSLGSKVLREPGGNMYVLQEFPAGGVPGAIMIKQDYDHNFIRDATYRFRNVKVLNGQTETWPPVGDINALITERSSDLNDNIGSNHFFFMDTSPEHLPTWETGPAIGSEGDYKTPGIKFTYGDSLGGTLTMYCNVTFVNKFETAAPTGDFVGLKHGKFEKLRFFINFAQGSSGQGLETLELRLVDNTATDYYFRDILPDIRGVTSSDGYVWLDYTLPLASINNDLGPATDNGWQRNRPGATLDKIDYLQFKFSPGEHWASDTTLKFAMMHFWRRLSVIKSSAGFPATTKLIVVKDNISKSAMSDYCLKEFSRTNQDMITAGGTIEGNTAFRHPGYGILVNYNQNIDANAVAILPMREIIHRIHNGRYTTTINCISANQGI